MAVYKDTSTMSGMDDPSPLHKAIIDHQVDDIRILLKMNKYTVSNLVTTDSDMSALHLACNIGFLEAVKIILDNGFDINSSMCLRSQTPLQVAILANQYDVVKYLLDRGAKVNVSANSGLGARPLTAALLACNRGIIRLLRVAGVRAIKTDCTCYMIGLFGKMQAIPLLNEAGLTINSTDDRRRTALHAAAGHDHLNIVGELLQNGALVNALDVDDKSPLHYAAELAASTHVLDLLVMHGAQVNIGERTTHGTPLHIACHEGIFSSIHKLVEIGADVNALDGFLETPLQTVLRDDSGTLWLHDNDPLRILIQAGADVNYSCPDHPSCLEVAIARKKYAAAEVLLLANAKAHESMCTPLLRKKSPELYMALEYAVSDVTTLRHTCRAVINSQMKFHWPLRKAIDKLPLPPLLKHYLLSRELSSCYASVEPVI